jgi:hypothetical protein
MKYPLTFILALIGFISKAQFVVSENLPDHVTSGVSQNFTISINKGNYTGFATYWLNAAPNVALRVVEVSGATVMDQDNRITLTWVSFPKDQEVIKVVFGLESTLTGEVELPNAFTWVESEAKMEMDLPPLVFITDANTNAAPVKQEPVKQEPTNPAPAVATTITATAPAVTVAVETPAQPAATPEPAIEKSAAEPAVAATATSYPKPEPTVSQPTQAPTASTQPRARITRVNPNLSPEELRMQISQLKHDAHEAAKVGELEKRTAEARLQLALSDSARAAKTKDKTAMDNASKEAQKARGDLDVAKSIIKLSADLTHDANEIEKQNAEKLAGLAPIDDPNKKETPKQKAARLRTEAAASIAKGERMRAEAQSRMQEAMTAEATANTMPEGAERDTALVVAKRNKQLAGEELKKADQLIRSGQDVESQANAMDPQKKMPSVALKKTEPKAQTKPEPVAKQPETADKENPAEPKLSWKERRAKEREERRLAKEEKARLKKEEEEKLAKGDYFTVQVGAFSGKPDMRLLRKAGKTFTVTEDGRTKVLCGRFATKDAAIKRKEELAAAGIPGYVVSYVNGQRVK